VCALTLGERGTFIGRVGSGVCRLVSHGFDNHEVSDKGCQDLKGDPSANDIPTLRHSGHKHGLAKNNRVRVERQNANTLQFGSDSIDIQP
jgi:hypothetical protein